MKITDLKQPTNEGIGDTIKNFFSGSSNDVTSSMDKQTKTAYNIGLKDFSNKLATAISSGISSGVIQKTVATSEPATNNQVQQVQPENPEQSAPEQSGQQEPAQSGQQSPTHAPSINEPVFVSPGHRIELHDKADNQLAYYKTEKGWFNAADQQIPPANTQGLEQAADAGGGVKYKAKEVPVIAPPPPLTKGGKQAQAQANRQANQNKKQKPQIKENSDYVYLNYLLESKILNEATISQYINKFVLNQVKNYEQEPDYTQAASQISQELEQSYIKDNKLDPKLLKKMWDLLWNWSHLGKAKNKTSSSNSSSYPDDAEVDSEEAKKLQQTAKFLMLAAQHPELLKSPKMKAYQKELADIVSKMGPADDTNG